MIESFADVNGSTKAEQVRAWSVQAAIEKMGDSRFLGGSVAKLAAEIEHFVLNGIDGFDGDEYDDETLNKVMEALTLDDGGFQTTPEGAQDAIRKMQNAGILFRTRSAT